MHLPLTSCLLALACAAAAGPGGEDFRLEEKTELLPEMGRIQRTVLHAQGWEFGFLRPAGWALAADAAARELRFRSPDYSISLVLRLQWATPQSSGANSAEALLARAQRLVAEAKLTERFSCYANHLPAHGFDFRQSLDSGLTACHRVVLVPFEGGLAELLLTSSAAKAAAARIALDGFLTSFTCEKPAPPPPPSQSKLTGPERRPPL